MKGTGFNVDIIEQEKRSDHREYKFDADSLVASGKGIGDVVDLPNDAVLVGRYGFWEMNDRCEHVVRGLPSVASLEREIRPRIPFGNQRIVIAELY